jgi:hypothetical protein
MQRGRYLNLAALVGALAIVTGTSPAIAQLPAGWTAADVAATKPKTAGSTTVSGTGATAVWTVTGTGGDVWDKADAGFQFAYTTLTGDGGITAHLLTQVGGADTDWSKTGTMLRESTDPSAAEAFLSYASASGGKSKLTFQPSFRANTGGKVAPGSTNPSDSYGSDAVEPIPGTHRLDKGPIWLRTQRQGTTYQHLVSDDGKNWLLLASEPVNVDPSKPVLAGIWASQGGSKTPNVVTYDNVSVTSDVVQPVASTQAPAPTLVQAIPGNGAVLLTFEPALNGAGTNIYRQTAGGKDKPVLVNTMPTANGFVVDTGVTNGTTYLYTLKSVVDLTKVGGTMVESVTGSSQALAEPQVPIAGLVSMDINTLNPGTTTLDTTGAKPTLTITGSGTDIWDATDGFRFAATSMSGDYSLTAAVLSKPTAGAGNTSAWVKAGVMIRETLDPGSRDALVAASSGNGVEFQERQNYRDNAGTSLMSQQGTKDAATTYPVWLKISRTGDSISGFQSTDGTTFTQIGKAFKQVNLSANTFAGLAVTAHTSDQKKSTLYGTGVFDASSIKIGAP